MRSIRLISTVMATAALSFGLAAPASAAIPPADAVFQIKTVVDGKTLCATSKTETGITIWFPLVACDAQSPAQRWKYTKNGDTFQNVASSACIQDISMARRDIICELGAARPLKWKQDDQGRVLHSYTRIDNVYWNVVKHNFRGPILEFSRRTNGTIPSNAAKYDFTTVAG